MEVCINDLINCMQFRIVTHCLLYVFLLVSIVSILVLLLSIPCCSLKLQLLALLQWVDVKALGGPENASGFKRKAFYWLLPYFEGWAYTWRRTSHRSLSLTYPHFVLCVYSLYITYIHCNTHMYSICTCLRTNVCTSSHF